MPSEDHAHPDATRQELAEGHLAALVERNRRDFGQDSAAVDPPPVRSVGIVGAGIMGTAIAAAHVASGLPVVLHDADPQALAAAPQRIEALLAGQPARQRAAGLLRLAADVNAVAQLVRLSADIKTVAGCDLVIESIVETAAAKRRLYQQLQPHLGTRTILTSNTSTIPIGQLAEGLADPSRFCGLHFFHPVGQRPLAEIIRGRQSGNAALAAAVGQAKRIGKMPLVVDDGPGFLVNRLLLPYLGEAMQLLLEGAGIEQIERAALDFGMAKGPLRLLDEIGLDTTLQGGWVLAEAFPDRIVAPRLLVAMIKAGRLGCKSGAGFFAYENGPEGLVARPDPEVQRIIAAWAGPLQQHTGPAILGRLLLPMVLEATRILEEHRVRDAGDVDLAVVFGLGFPQSSGGLLWWADTLGAARILEMLDPWKSLGPRVEPTDMLRDMAGRGGRFYPG